MLASLATLLILLVALGSALMAGTFFAFSNFVMPALGKLPAEQGIAAMQSIDRVVLNPLFLFIFTGTAIAAAILALIVFPTIGELPSILIAIAALCYIIGTFGVTIVFNVPLNKALEAVSPASAEGATLWQRYLKDWVFWNPVRTVLPTIGLMLLMISLLVMD